MGELVANREYPIDISKEEFRANAFELQGRMVDMLADNPELELATEVSHYFAPGMYGRELLMPKGSMIVGKIHKHAHINVISQGVIEVLTEFSTVRYEAPITFVSEPGTKRCVSALEDTIWTTLHATCETDLDKIEAEVIAEDYEVIV